MRETKNHSALEQKVIRTLIYYDIFNYPLKAKEVFRFLGMNSVSEKDVEITLNALSDQGYIYRFKEFYSLQPKEANIVRRLNGNTQAQQSLPTAKKIALLIAKFPFTRAVMASGSLSKDYMDENSDFDFFIVTAENRLWICRMLLAMYKRVFLNNSHKFFCANYFVDTKHMEIEEKNLFTATELASVIPLYGCEYYHQLQDINHKWLLNYFPNFKRRSCEDVPNAQIGTSKKIVETMINVFFGNLVEKLIMGIAGKRWKKLYEKKYEQQDFKVAFKTEKHASKNHPRNYQRKVMDLFEQKIETFSKRFELNEE